jgi:hypothetical protein
MAHLFLDKAGAEFLGEELGQGGFSHPDGPFDRDIAGGLGFGHLR